MHRQILLTGATGALGPALAAELAREHAAQHIAVMFRGTPAEIPERFNQWLAAVRALLPLHDHTSLHRLHPVSGDICQDNLGLASDSLQRDTDVVIHAAADTNFSAPPERQWAVNVEGTRHMLEWSAQCRHLRRFLLVSSIYVSGSRTGRIPETATAIAPDFVTHYQRTKWEAEQLALKSGLPLAIARVSLILGSHATGAVHRTGAVHSMIKWFARGLLPMFPGLPAATGDVIATETAAQCLSHAVMADWHASRDTPIWHIAASDLAPKMTDITDFVYDQLAARPAWLRKRIPRVRLVEQKEFDHMIAAIDASGHRAVVQALRSVNRFLPDLCFPKTYDTTRAQSLWGGPLPHYDWRQTLSRVVQFCCPLEKGDSRVASPYYPEPLDALGAGGGGRDPAGDPGRLR